MIRLNLVTSHQSNLPDPLVQKNLQAGDGLSASSCPRLRYRRGPGLIHDVEKKLRLTRNLMDERVCCPSRDSRDDKVVVQCDLRILPRDDMKLQSQKIASGLQIRA